MSEAVNASERGPRLLAGRYRVDGLLGRAGKIIDSRFVVAQLLAATNDPDAAAAELTVLRPLLVAAFTEHSAQVRNLDKQVTKLRLPDLGARRLGG